MKRQPSADRRRRPRRRRAQAARSKTIKVDEARETALRLCGTADELLVWTFSSLPAAGSNRFFHSAEGHFEL